MNDAARPHAGVAWFGYASLAGFIVAMVTSVTGDPLALTLPSSVLAVVAGAFSVRRRPERASGQAGFHGGVLLLFLWVVFQILGHLIGYDFYTMPVIWRP